MKKVNFVLFIFIFILIGFNASAKIIDVPFLSQVAPGDWDNTLNCGQTSYYMSLSFLRNDENLNYEEIKKLDDWLNKKYGDPIRNYNGYYTNIKKIKALAIERDGLPEPLIKSGNGNFDNLKQEIDSGNPVIILARVGMKLDKMGHFMLMLGYDDEYIYTNDPGKVLGEERKYLISDFMKVWKTENYYYIVLRKDNALVSKPKIYEYSYSLSSHTNNFLQYINPNMYCVSKILKDLNKIYVSKTENNLISSSLNGNQINEPKLPKNKDFLLSNRDEIIKIETNYESIDSLTDDNVFQRSELPVNSVEVDLENNNINRENKLIVDNAYDLTDSSRFLKISEDLILDMKPPIISEADIGVEDSKTLDLKTEPENKPEESDSESSLEDEEDKSSQDDTQEEDEGNNMEIENNENNKDLEIHTKQFNSQEHIVINDDYDDYIINEGEYLVCNLVIPYNKTLTLKPGVKIKIQKDCGFLVNGKLLALGEENKKVYFTSSFEQKKMGDWYNIKFENSVGSELNYVDVGYGGYYQFQGQTSHQLIISNSKIKINNINIHDGYSVYGGLEVVNSLIDLKNSFFTQANPGLLIQNSFGIVENNIFDSNKDNVVVNNCNEGLVFKNNEIKNASRFAVDGYNNFSFFENNNLINNRYNIISMRAMDLDSGEYYLKKNVYNINNINIKDGAILNIEKGTIIKFSGISQGKFVIRGRVYANGSMDEKIVFTSLADDAWGGDSNNDNNLSSPSMGDWGYLDLSNSNGSKFENCIFRYGGKDRATGEYFGALSLNNTFNVKINNSIFEYFFKAVDIKNSNNLLFDYSAVKNNFYGIIVESSSNILFKNNLIFNNKTGIMVTSSVNVNNEDNMYEDNYLDYLEN